ncbi:MAG: acetyl-CoA carboxylase biotin carboxyl carrier protein, partial [Candidatus Limnocylindria bacterium]
MADPKKVRAEANALVEELLARLDAADVRELEVRRGTLRVKVTKGPLPQLFAPVPAAAPAARANAAPQAAGPAVVSADPAAAPTDAVTAPLTGVFYLS